MDANAQDISEKSCPTCGLTFGLDLEVCPHDGSGLVLSKPDPLIGQRFADRYQIISRVGRGGMSIVYQARHELMDRLVAIKMLHSTLLDDAVSIKRFQQEAQAASRLSHPHLITVFDFGILPSGQPYLVMDYLLGESLSDVLDREGFIGADRCARICVQVCDALSHSHQMGVLHRDLKPSNIMLLNMGGQRDFVKVVDFGLATFLPHAGIQTQKLTLATEVFGSPLYMSPEQCRGEEMDARSDIYSMGCVMYEAVAGVTPFVGDNWMETMRMQALDEPKPPSECRPDLNIPKAMDRTVLRALEKQPEDRFQNMEQLKQALESVLTPSKRPASIELHIPADMSESAKPTILVVEDLENLRKHMVDLIATRIPGPPRVREAVNGAEALKMWQQLNPDMIVMDISMPEVSGIKAAQQIWAQRPQMKILFWSQYHREAYVRELGRIVPDEAIHGYALKSESDEKLAYAIVSILLYDNPYIDPVVRAVQKRLRTREQPLSDEEYETLIDLVCGMSDRAIATRRHISIRGVQSRISMLQTKILGEIQDASGREIYDPRNRMVFEAVSRGLVNVDEIPAIDSELHEWLTEEFDL